MYTKRYVKVLTIVESSSSNEVFKVYFKYLVSDETLAGIGVSICDKCDGCVFVMKKPIILDDDSEDGVNGEAVGLNALIEALDTAIGMRIKVVHVLCDSDQLRQYAPEDYEVFKVYFKGLLNDHETVETSFGGIGVAICDLDDYCVFEVRKQVTISRDMEGDVVELLALIEGLNSAVELRIKRVQILCDNHLVYQYHVEAKLLQGQLPNCPHENCKSKLQTESYSKFLDPKLYDLMNLWIKESSIPSTEKVYCPFPNCSALMSKTEVKKHTATSSYKRSGMRKCVKCQRCFCINCKVAWHEDITCNGYIKHYQSGNEVKFECLASWQCWRQCIKCKHMVELAEGCYHVTCREKALRLIEVTVVNVILESPCNAQPKFSRSGSYLGSFYSL
uniref:Ribonuclease H domain-containing protein n=1 Tax=Tanacetum cinerariifolium TaxID=118510 RepID=A0A6L2L6D9_TANCI|nr:ribonuclease H domain-containing protein [Tanacetum cinerariifolium]